MALRSESKRDETACMIENDLEQKMYELLSNDWKMVNEIMPNIRTQLGSVSNEASRLANQIREDEEKLQKLLQTLEEKMTQFDQLRDEKEELSLLESTPKPTLDYIKRLTLKFQGKRAKDWSVDDVSIFLYRAQLSEWVMPMRNEGVDGELLLTLTKNTTQLKNITKKPLSMVDWKRLQYHVQMGEKGMFHNQEHDVKCPVCEASLESMLEEYQVERLDVECLQRQQFTVKELIMLDIEDLLKLTDIESPEERAKIMKNICAIKTIHDNIVDEL